VGVSPAYIHLIELGKEKPPRPEIIVEIAKSLSADLDHLFRLASRLDPEIVNYLNTNPLMLSTIRYAKIAKLSQSEQKEIYNFVENLSLKK
jgi:transcriptional regulator with XRE-family HTH domain